jgi:hypothetical protein
VLSQPQVWGNQAIKKRMNMDEQDEQDEQGMCPCFWGKVPMSLGQSAHVFGARFSRKKGMFYLLPILFILFIPVKFLSPPCGRLF